MKLSPDHKYIAQIILLFLGVALAVYGLSLGNGFVDYDDGLLIYDNLSVMRPLHISSITWALTHYDPELYIPLTFLSLQLDSFIGGLHPFVFHLHNLFLHTVNGLLVTWLIFLLYRRRNIAILCGLIFLVHPFNTEAVAWASARKDLLSTVFFLATVVGYLYYRVSQNRRLNLLLVALFILGLMAKVTIAPLPIVLLLIDWREDGYVSLRGIWQKIPFFLVALLFGLIAVLGKDVVFARTPFSVSVLLAFKATVFYVQKFFLPTNLSIFYPYDPELASLYAPDILFPIILVLCSFAVLWYHRHRAKEWIFGVSFFLLMLLTSFAHITRGVEVYFATDRYAYIPMIGFLCILAYVLKNLIHSRWVIAQRAIIVILIVFSFAAMNRSLAWKSTFTLFQDSLRYHESFLGYTKIGAELLREKKYFEATEMFYRSIEIMPNADAYYNLGVAAMEQGKTGNAIAFTKEALRIGFAHPQAHVNMSKFYWDDNKKEEAIGHAEKAVEYAPHSMMALGNLATMYTLTGQKEKALTVIESILYLEPGNKRVQPLLKKLEE